MTIAWAGPTAEGSASSRGVAEGACQRLSFPLMVVALAARGVDANVADMPRLEGGARHALFPRRVAQDEAEFMQMRMQLAVRFVIIVFHLVAACVVKRQIEGQPRLMLAVSRFRHIPLRARFAMGGHAFVPDSLLSFLETIARKNFDMYAER